MCVLIVLGGAVILTASQFPKNPGGFGPGFYPTLVACLLIGFCLLELLTGKEKSEEASASSKEGNLKLLGIVGSLIVFVLLMQYVNIILAIALFLFFYLRYISKVALKSSIWITVGGTAVLYLVILLLKIPV